MEVPGLAELVYDAEEQLQPAAGQLVSGQLPGWLAGSLYRAGPSKFSLGDGFTVRHWFDGLAMVCRFAVGAGHVTIQKRFVQSDAYKKAVKHNKLIYTEFGTRGHPDPSKNFISRMVSSILPTDMTDNNFNNMYSVNGQLFAACETALIHRMEPSSLETLEKVDLYKLLGVNLCCSHPVTDTDGTVYTLGVTFIPGFKYQLNKIPPAPAATDGREAFGAAKCLLSMSSSWTTAYSYYHSFGLTENYIVLLEQPLVMVLSKVMSMVVKGNSLKDCMEWHPEYNVKLYVVHKTDGKLVKTKYVTDVPFFQSHICNAFEDGDQIILDMVTSEGPDMLDAMFLDKMSENKLHCSHPGRITRLAIPVLEDVKKAAEGVNLVTSQATTATAVRSGDTVTLTLDLFPDAGVEYPTINPRLRGKPYRHLYVSGLYDQGAFRSGIGKLDMVGRSKRVWRGEPATFPSEATFVPRPDGAAEDDGVLLLTLLGTGGRPDHLVLLDAASMEPLARVRFDCRIPQMVHGHWVPDEKAEKAQ
ncbi:beta,beta-carotene 9',10'-oxygenase-like [Pollicipes pollicipes]|uniref:beta,beta-carotene 9',10'-oxygenase-like n=1 Tax=Pollicipes pollicipes TaxID=41117 RepID=UPI001884C15A|nr:beta,beta-carotene 9',10'-oxygenase-like [Pollicipes pollicipes]